MSTTAALAATGFPPDARMFAELLAAASRLGPVQQEWETLSEETHGPVTMTMRAGGDGRRDGFEILRDVITRYRRAWAEQHLTAYVEARWKGELEAAGQAYHRHAADKGKPPTVRQFMTMAATAADNWFAGDLTAVYTALGLRSPVPPLTYTRLVPDNVRAFKVELRRDLDKLSGGKARNNKADIERRNRLSWLTNKGMLWVELYEANGEPPDLKGFGTRNFQTYAPALSADVENAWRLYGEAVQRALTAAASAPRPNTFASAPTNGDESREPQPTAATTRDRAQDGSTGEHGPAPSTPPPERTGWREMLRRFRSGSKSS